MKTKHLKLEFENQKGGILKNMKPQAMLDLLKTIIETPNEQIVFNHPIKPKTFYGYEVTSFTTLNDKELEQLLKNRESGKNE